MNKALMVRATRLLSKTKFTVKKYSPEILLGAGIISGVAATVAACKGTLKVDKVLAEHHENMEKIKSMPVSKKYTEEDRKKDTTITYVKTIVKIGKLYAPAVGLGTMAIVSVLASYGKMKKANVALAAAYTALDKSTKEYRQRVIDKIGKEAEEKLWLNIEEKEIEEEATDEKGKTKKVKRKVPVVNGKGGSIYSKYLTRSNPNWADSADYVELVMRGKQNYYNDQLQAKGYLIMNDLYRDMGFDDTKEGMIAGYTSTMDNPQYMRITVKEEYLPSENDGELEKCYLIDYLNVDPNIYQKLE